MKKLFFLAAIAALCFTTSCKDNTVTPINDNPTGLLLNTPTALENVNEADIDEKGFTLPASFSLNGPPIVNQGETSKCVTFSAGYYITSMYNGVTSTDLNKAGSPDFLYGQYKKINKDAECNKGCFLFSDASNGITGAAEILKQYGTTSWAQMPFEDANVCPNITSTLVTQAENNKIKGYYRLDKTESSKVTELKSWIYAGYPLFFGVDIDQAFQDLKAGDIYTAKAGKSYGGHAMVCVGYDDAKKAFKIANSWGPTWADNGFTWIDYTFFTKLLTEDGGEIGILTPNATQRVNMGKVSPIACGSANWGDILVKNTRSEEIAIEIVSINYNNTNARNVDAKEMQLFTKIPKGDIIVRVLTANKASLIKEYTATVASCNEIVLDVN